MDRRKFIATGVLSSMGVASMLNACAEPIDNSEDDKLESTSFLLEETSIAKLQQEMETGTLTSEMIIRKYLERIEKIDKNGAALNSIVEINPDALEIARKMDAERKSGNVRGLMHGIPVVLKDNIDTADKMHTTAGALALADNIASTDSYVARKLREAGAVILAKANLSEWANFRSTRSSSGWSGRGGQTRNPYILDRNPCGSSSGSAVSVSANLSVVSIGTETNGSVVCPSTTNGIVGIKPTVGLIGRSGIIPISHTQDTAGPMGRTVTDAAILLGVLTGIDDRDDITKESNNKRHSDYTQFLKSDGLSGKRIGVYRKTFGFHEKVDAIMEEALETMRKAGAEIIDFDNILPDEKYGTEAYQVLLYEFKDGVNKYLNNTSTAVKVKSLKEVIAFNEANRDASMPYFEQEILIEAEATDGLEADKYKSALEKVLLLTREKGLDKTIDDNNLDAIVAPTGGPAWTTDLINGDHFGGGSSSPAARSGYPNITVPAGNVSGLPVGISIFGKAYHESQLIEIAYAYEQLSNKRIVPEFKPTLNISVNNSL